MRWRVRVECFARDGVKCAAAGEGTISSGGRVGSGSRSDKGAKRLGAIGILYRMSPQTQLSGLPEREL